MSALGRRTPDSLETSIATAYMAIAGTAAELADRARTCTVGEARDLALRARALGDLAMGLSMIDPRRWEPTPEAPARKRTAARRKGA